MSNLDVYFDLFSGNELRNVLEFVQCEKVEFGLRLLIILPRWLIPVGFSIKV